MRNTLTCPKCQGSRILMIAKVPDTGEFQSEVRDLHVGLVKTGTSWLGQDRLERVGKLTAAVCRACGYTEFYTEAPDSIPVDGELITEVVGPAKGPYRG